MPRFAAHCGGARVILKREDLNHTGSHKINNVLGQALLTKRMGKTRVIAETGAGQHGVATATAAALLGLDCTVYMGEVDTERQALNVARMQLLGAEVVPVDTGSATLKDAINEALRDWVTNVDDTHYLFGTVAGPHPFPEMVRDFHTIIGDEARAQVLELTGRLPDAVIACVGGGSNAMGIFHRFLDDAGVRAHRHRGRRRRRRDRPARGAIRRDGDPGRAARRDELPHAGRRRPDRRVALDLRRAWTTRASGPSTPGCATAAGPSTATPPTTEAMEAFRLLSRTEGIIPAIESAHALVGAMEVGAGARPRRPAARQPLRPRRQGHGDRREVVRAAARGRHDRRTVLGVEEVLRRCREEGRAALVGYLPVGFPTVEGSIEAMRVLVEAGCDVIEVGVPYSDPLMDGPVIQHAAATALAGGSRVDDVFRATAAVRAAGGAAARHDLLEPRDAPRGRAVRRRPRRRTAAPG